MVSSSRDVTSDLDVKFLCCSGVCVVPVWTGILCVCFLGCEMLWQGLVCAGRGTYTLFGSVSAAAVPVVNEGY